MTEVVKDEKTKQKTEDKEAGSKKGIIAEKKR